MKEHSINKQQEAKSSFLVKKSHIFKVVGMFRPYGYWGLPTDFHK